MQKNKSCQRRFEEEKHIYRQRKKNTQLPGSKREVRINVSPEAAEKGWKKKKVILLSLHAEGGRRVERPRIE